MQAVTNLQHKLYEKAKKENEARGKSTRTRTHAE
jgi:hypothetical protein